MSREALSRFARSVVCDAVLREEHDFYPTPPSATRALLAVESFPGVVWEPACGEGDMARVLEAGGCEVIATDLIDRGYGRAPVDFLRDFAVRADHIVTNPPFTLSLAFAQHGLMRVPGKVALLCRLGWMTSTGRRRFLEERLSRVWVFADRVRFQRGRLLEDGERGAPMMDFAWYVFDPAHSGPVTLGWIANGSEGAELPPLLAGGAG